MQTIVPVRPNLPLSPASHRWQASRCCAAFATALQICSEFSRWAGTPPQDSIQPELRQLQVIASVEGAATQPHRWRS